MASSLGLVVLTYDGTDIQDIDGIHLDLRSGGPGDIPEVRGRDDIALGRDGRMVRNRRRDRRVIELAGHIFGAGSTFAAQTSDHWDNRLAFAALFDPTELGELVVTLPNGDAYTINCRPEPVPIVIQVAPMLANVSMALESVDPDWVVSVGS